VEEVYRENHEKQTFDYVIEQKQSWLKFDKMQMGIWEAAEFLNTYVDNSDPDLDLPQIAHLLQTAESCRKMFPDQDWLHLTGFIHDLGKVMGHSKFGSAPQWAVVGDIFPVGCAFSPSIVFPQHFKHNPDTSDPRFSSPQGVYGSHCSLNNVHMSWGHDEYMYQVMVHNGCTLPPAAFFVVRFHSFYALHTQGAYHHLLNPSDHEHLHWLKEFNKSDLYTKSLTQLDVKELKPYYEGLIAKYFPKQMLDW